MLHLFKLDSLGVCLKEKPNIGNTNKDSATKSTKNIIGMTESWATINISDVELGITGYVMFRKDRTGTRGG